LSRRHEERTGERGQALIELAVVAPILILIIAGLVQFGVIWERQIGINNAIRDAARISATWEAKDTGTALSNAQATVDKVRALLTNSQTYDENRMTVEVCVGTPSAHPLDPASNHQVDVRIKIEYRHPLFLPLVDLILDGIDGSNDQSLLASNVTEFHVEQSGDNNIASQAATFPVVSGATCTM
jgi:Flp pilus assembly protein TadG